MKKQINCLRTAERTINCFKWSVNKSIMMTPRQAEDKQDHDIWRTWFPLKATSWGAPRSKHRNFLRGDVLHLREHETIGIDEGEKKRCRTLGRNLESARWKNKLYGILNGDFCRIHVKQASNTFNDNLLEFLALFRSLNYMTFPYSTVVKPILLLVLRPGKPRPGRVSSVLCYQPKLLKGNVPILDWMSPEWPLRDWKEIGP